MSEISPRTYHVEIIDGTGPPDPDYGTVMAGGFCHQLEASFKAQGHTAEYQRGPMNSGSGLSNAVATAVGRAALDRGKSIVLVGYSRGAFGCVLAAESLKKITPEGIEIWGMILFDPVGRYLPAPFTHVIPNNVRQSFTALRQLGNPVIEKYEGSMSDVDAINRVAMANPFRPSFGRNGVGAERGGLYKDGAHVIKTYLGSHGALGGVGYEWVSEDGAAQTAICRDVVAWGQERLSVSLKMQPNNDPVNGKGKLSPYVRGVKRTAR